MHATKDAVTEPVRGRCPSDAKHRLAGKSDYSARIDDEYGLRVVFHEGAKPFFHLLMRLSEQAELGFGNFPVLGSFSFLLNNRVPCLF